MLDTRHKHACEQHKRARSNTHNDAPKHATYLIATLGARKSTAEHEDVAATSTHNASGRHVVRHTPHATCTAPGGIQVQRSHLVLRDMLRGVASGAQEMPRPGLRVKGAHGTGFEQLHPIAAGHNHELVTLYQAAGMTWRVDGPRERQEQTHT